MSGMPNLPPPNPRQDQLLAGHPEGEYAHLSTHLELVPLLLGMALCESGEGLSQVYFPTTAIVSRLYVRENDASAEIAVVGNEGIIGISLFMGVETTPNRAVVESACHAHRLKGQVLKQQFARFDGRRHGALHPLLLRYTMALPTQMAQTAVFNRHSRSGLLVPDALLGRAVAEDSHPYLEQRLAKRSCAGAIKSGSSRPVT